MNFKQFGLALGIILFSSTLNAQTEIIDLVKEGIQYHDNGDYAKAIKTYEKALKIDPNSTLANYEISMSYFAKGDYKQAIKYSDMVLDQKKEYLLEAYINKGSSLDLLGKTKEAIKLFEKAIKETKGDYLLYFNLALTHYKLNDLTSAEENVIKAILDKPSHSSSHLMLAMINEQLGNRIPALLASHYFLMLEPNSKRSQSAYAILQKNFVGNVSKDPNKPNTINISLTPNGDEQFAAAELMLSMLEASKSIEENKNKTDDELFIENTESFFKMMGELKKEKNKEIWWTFYATFYYDLAQSEHLATYCKFITQCKNENSRNWVNSHEEQVNSFVTWANGQ